MSVFRFHLWQPNDEAASSPKDFLLCQVPEQGVVGCRLEELSGLGSKELQQQAGVGMLLTWNAVVVRPFTSPAKGIPCSGMVWIRRVLKDLPFHPCHGQGQLPLSQGAPRPAQSSLGHFQGCRCSHSISGHLLPESHHSQRQEFLPNIHVICPQTVWSCSPLSWHSRPITLGLIGWRQRRHKLTECPQPTALSLLWPPLFIRGFEFSRLTHLIGLDLRLPNSLASEKSAA